MKQGKTHYWLIHIQARSPWWWNIYWSSTTTELMIFPRSISCSWHKRPHTCSWLDSYYVRGNETGNNARLIDSFRHDLRGDGTSIGATLFFIIRIGSLPSLVNWQDPSQDLDTCCSPITLLVCYRLCIGFLLSIWRFDSWCVVAKRYSSPKCENAQDSTKP